MNESRPLISVAIATFNSAKTLERTLSSLRKQNYPQDKIEILVVDGKSSDQTVQIAKKFKCKIITNPKRELIFGKHLGYLKAKGRYLVFLDSDEVLENPNSLKLKLHAFQKDERVRAVFLSGYKTPRNFFPINHYSNEFGEPFSFFVYRESKGDEYLLNSWKSKYRKVFEDKDCAIFDFSQEINLPIIELWAGGSAVDLRYVKENFPEIRKNPDLVAHLFYLLNAKGCLLAITKQDPTLHYSSESLGKYLKKINSRVSNNVWQTKMGAAGFGGRERFQPLQMRIMKYLFIPYGLTVVLPLIDAISLAISRKNPIYLMHLPLSVYTAGLISYYYGLKMLRISPRFKTYGR